MFCTNLEIVRTTSAIFHGFPFAPHSGSWCTHMCKKWPFCGSGYPPPAENAPHARRTARSATALSYHTARASLCRRAHDTASSRGDVDNKIVHPPPTGKAAEVDTRTPRSVAYQPRSAARNPRRAGRLARALCPCTGQAPTGTARWARSNPSTPGGARSRGREASARLNCFPLLAALPPRGVPVIWSTSREFSSTAHAVRFP